MIHVQIFITILTLNYIKISECFSCSDLHKSILDKYSSYSISGSDKYAYYRKCDSGIFTNRDPLKATEILILDCKLTELPDEAFKFYPNLLALKLNSNKLTRYPSSDWFPPGSKLEQLHMSNNILRNPRADLFRNLNNLKALDLSQNTINNIANNVLDALPNLVALNLSHNILTGFISGSLDGPNLLTLDLSYNEVDYLDEDVFDSLSKLTYLNLEHNKITNLSKRFFDHMQRLEVLHIGGNPIVDLWTGLGNLKDFDMSYLGMTVPENVLTNRLLQCLDVSGNRLKAIGNFQANEFQGLRFLNLSHNRMETFALQLAGDVRNLEILDVSYNNITMLPKMKLHIISLEYLYAQGNQIKSIDMDFIKGHHRLKYLDISENKIVALDQSLLLPHVRSIHLLGNPFECHCLELLFLEMKQRQIFYEERDYFRGTKPYCVILNPNSTDCKFSDSEIEQHYNIFRAG